VLRKTALERVPSWEARGKEQVLETTVESGSPGSLERLRGMVGDSRKVFIR
jgi:hypothetical protein